MSDEINQLEGTAYHEAGHAVMAFILRVPIKYATIIPDEDSSGSVIAIEHFTDEDIYIEAKSSLRIRKKIEANVMVFMAGKISEEKYTGKVVDDVIHDDMAYFDWLSILASSEDEVSAYANWLYIRTEHILLRDENWFLVQALAMELLKKKHIRGHAIRTLLHEARHRFLDNYRQFNLRI